MGNNNKSKKQKWVSGGGGNPTVPKLRAQRAENHKKPETTGARRSREKGERKKGGGGTRRQGPGRPGAGDTENGRPGRRKTEKKQGAEKETKNQAKGNPSLAGADNPKRATKTAKEQVTRTRMRRGGRRAAPSQEEQAHAQQHGSWAWHPPTEKSTKRGGVGVDTKQPRCPGRGPHGMTDGMGPTPEGSARDNPRARPQTGTTLSEPSAPASAEASSRHQEPVFRSASLCPAQPLSKSGGESTR